MSKVVAIIGDTGTGKSRSLLNLKPEETFVINVLNKPLPFKGSAKLYNKEAKTMINSENYSVILNTMKSVNDNAKHIKNLIIDDAGFIMTSELFARAKESGYGKFTEIGTHMQQIISQAKEMREDLNVVFMFHEEDDISDKVKVGKKIRTIGQMLEDKYNPIATVSVALFTDVSFSKEGEAKYGFITNRTQRGSIVIPAKSPEGMFPEAIIPNDLNVVFTKMNEYYNG